MKKQLLVAMVIIVTSSNATAADVRYYFDCDAAPAHFSMWRRTTASPKLLLSGTLALLEARDDPTWLPVASIHLEGAIDGQRAGVNITRPRDNPNLLEVVLVEEASPSATKKVGQFANSGAPFGFELELSPSGQLRISVSGIVTTTQISGFRVARVGLACSTADFEFDKIEVKEVDAAL